MRSPALRSEDVTLGKEFPLFKEGQKLEFKASAFNIGNRVQFGDINNSVESPDFGRITSQATDPRILQFGVKYGF